MSYKPTQKEYYPIFKEICQDTGIPACELNYICFLTTNGLTTQGTPTQPKTQKYIQININLTNILKSMIASDSATKREQDKRTTENPPLEMTYR